MSGPVRVGPHTLVVGKTDSGKSSAVQRLCREFIKPSGRPILLLDPKKDPAFLADFMTANAAEFMREVRARAGEQCAVIMDESAKTAGQWAGEMAEVATMNRELGHRGFFITQRAAKLDKDIVLNCSNLMVFRSSGRDCKVLAEDFGRSEILEAVNYDQGVYLWVPSFGPLSRRRLF